MIHQMDSILSNYEKEILANKAKDLYGFVINKDQILMLLLITFKCKIIISIINAENKVLIGKANHFGRNPLRLVFLAPKDCDERLVFENILLNSEENELNLDSTVQAKAKTKKTNELIINAQEIESHKIKEKLFGIANEV